jgi:regulatory protein
VRFSIKKTVSTTHWSREAADKIIERLKEQDLVDDVKFVEWFVRQRTTLKPKSERMLTRELKMKGIGDEIIEKYFSKNSLDEESLALKILEKRWPRYHGLSKEKRFEKASRFLMSRGFNYDIIRKTISKLQSDTMSYDENQS